MLSYGKHQAQCSTNLAGQRIEAKILKKLDAFLLDGAGSKNKMLHNFVAAPAFPLKWITIIIFHMQIFAVLPEQVASQSHE